MATQFVHEEIRIQETARAGAPRRYLHGPLFDFLTFGGSSLLILPLLMLLSPSRYIASFTLGTMLLAHVVNHPHFAHSYQIFYRGFARKAFTPVLGRVMQARYLFAGIVAPTLMIVFLVASVISENIRLLGYAANAMALSVGWHYVKQGYGLLMVDCALKRQFFNDTDKKLLLVNSYAVWVASWLYFNHLASKATLWGIDYYAFKLPGWLVIGAVAVAAGSSVVTARMFFSVWRAKGSLPTNGIIAYCVSLYVWLAFVTINPLFLVLAPALHSLQYLGVVWRFETNFAREKSREARDKAITAPLRSAGNPVGVHLFLFILAAGALGFFGFWMGPLLLTMVLKAPQAALGTGVFLFSAWVFINIHHYFMDNVMWRRDNPDSKKYLFG